MAQCAVDKACFTLLACGVLASVLLSIALLSALLAPSISFSVERNFDTAASTLLTATAVIVTTLGVVGAILGFWGFNNIKQEAIKAALESAVERATKEARDKATGTIDQYLKGFESDFGNKIPNKIIEVMEKMVNQMLTEFPENNEVIEKMSKILKTFKNESESGVPSQSTDGNEFMNISKGSENV